MCDRVLLAQGWQPLTVALRTRPYLCQLRTDDSFRPSTGAGSVPSIRSYGDCQAYVRSTTHEYFLGPRLPRTRSARHNIPALCSVNESGPPVIRPCRGLAGGRGPVKVPPWEKKVPEEPRALVRQPLASVTWRRRALDLMPTHRWQMGHGEWQWYDAPDRVPGCHHHHAGQDEVRVARAVGEGKRARQRLVMCQAWQ